MKDITVTDGFNITGAKLDRTRATLADGILLHTKREELLSKLNMNQLEGDIASFHGKTVEAANKHSKAIVWKQIAEMSGMELVPEERFVNTYSGRFLVTQYTWRRDE